MEEWKKLRDLYDQQRDSRTETKNKLLKINRLFTVYGRYYFNVIT